MLISRDTSIEAMTDMEIRSATLVSKKYDVRLIKSFQVGDNIANMQLNFRIR
jgi:hypothetical protein